MTRGNLTIKSYGNKWLFEMSNYPVPEDVVPELLIILSEFNHRKDIPLSRLRDTFDDMHFGHIGNPDYIYEVDIEKKEIAAWETRNKWVNAPDNWDEKGWNGIYKGKNGRMGYMSVAKGKRIDISNYIEEHIFNTKL